MKAQSKKKLVQDHNFWEIRDGREEKFWEDSWNQCPKLGDDTKWKYIRESRIREGKTKVCKYWVETNTIRDYRKWWERIIVNEETQALMDVLKERCIHKKGQDKLRCEYLFKGVFSIKEAYNINNRGEEEHE